jgi:hypothetical protein
MELKNSTLDDIATVIGFTATTRLSAWYGDFGNLYVPVLAADNQTLIRLLGESAAKKLSQEWGGQHLAIPRLSSYEDDQRKRFIGSMLARGCPTREIATLARVGERRVQQVCRELEAAGLIPVIAPKKVSQEKPVSEKGAFLLGDFMGKTPGGKGA